jgi:hypothetical protein
MKRNEILENLCSRDKRNPNSYLFALWGGPDGRGEECYCDNCFYGRTELAEELLKYVLKEQEEEQEQQ